jgi:predicted nucleic acid-binding protein
MTILVDTNILLRSVDQASAEHLVSVNALRTLNDRGDDLVICAQVVIEFWSVATRPAANNGRLITINIADFRQFADIQCAAPDELLGTASP